MNDQPYTKRFAEIVDPFVEDVALPVRSLEPPRLADAVATSPTRSRIRSIRRTAFVSALLYEVVYVVVVEHPFHRAPVSTSQLTLGLAIPLVAALAAFAAASRRGPRGLGLSAGWVALLVAAAPTFFAIATLAATPDQADSLFWRHAAGCAAVTSTLALGPLGLGLWAYRRAFVAAARWRGAAVGIAAGALAAASMRVACPLDSSLHMIVGHGAVMLVAGLAGALLAPAVVRS